MKYQKLASLRNVTCWPIVIGTSLDYREDDSAGLDTGALKVSHWYVSALSVEISIPDISASWFDGNLTMKKERGKSVMTYDTVLEYVGQFGRFQKKIFLWMCLVSFLTGPPIVVFAFTGAMWLLCWHVLTFSLRLRAELQMSHCVVWRDRAVNLLCQWDRGSRGTVAVLLPGGDYQAVWQVPPPWCEV